jgi:hypothetical protein
METKLYLDIKAQPDQTTCGPTCLDAVYRYFDDDVPLVRIIREVTALEGGGTLAVYLACHALRRGYRAEIYTYNLKVFDPTWFSKGGGDIPERLRLQLRYKKDEPILRVATHAYLEFLELGGRLRFEVLTAALIRRYLNRGIPIMTGLSATYLYASAREYGEGDTLHEDDLRGESTGHFVVLSGYDKKQRQVFVADPLRPNPLSPTQYYPVHIYRLICAIMIGILTYDGNLIIIEPRKTRGTSHPGEGTSRFYRAAP